MVATLEPGDMYIGNVQATDRGHLWIVMHCVLK